MTRLSVGFLIVFISYNPSGYSYVHWLARGDGGPLPLKIAAGVFLLIVLYLFLSVTYSVFRVSGVIVGASTLGLLSAQALFIGLPETMFESLEGYVLWATYVLLVTLAMVIGFGLSWSALINRFTGQEQKRYVRRAE